MTTHDAPRAPLACALTLGLAGLAACAAPRAQAPTPESAAPAPAARPPLDAGRLRPGRFAYRTVVDGHDAGGAEITVARIDARRYRFANEVTGAFRQSWESIATVELAPLSATLGLGASDDKRRTMRLVYDGGAVTGTATRVDPTTGPRSDAVAAELPRDVVDQRIDWAALMSSAWRAGDTVRFSVYDPWTGISRLSARLADRGDIMVPAGHFATLHIVYLIEKPRGAERYEIWVSERELRFLVRELFPGGAVTELVRIAE